MIFNSYQMCTFMKGCTLKNKLGMGNGSLGPSVFDLHKTFCDHSFPNYSGQLLICNFQIAATAKPLYSPQCLSDI